MKKILFILIFIAIIFSISIYFISPANAVRLGNPWEVPVATSTNTAELIGRVAGLMVGIAGSFALLMFAYGGFTIITSAGDDQKVTKGKQNLIWSAVGLILILSSWMLVQWVFDIIIIGPMAGEDCAEVAAVHDVMPSCIERDNSCEDLNLYGATWTDGDPGTICENDPRGEKRCCFSVLEDTCDDISSARCEKTATCPSIGKIEATPGACEATASADTSGAEYKCCKPPIPCPTSAIIKCIAKSGPPMIISCDGHWFYKTPVPGDVLCSDLNDLCCEKNPALTDTWCEKTTTINRCSSSSTCACTDGKVSDAIAQAYCEEYNDPRNTCCKQKESTESPYYKPETDGSPSGPGLTVGEIQAAVTKCKAMDGKCVDTGCTRSGDRSSLLQKTNQSGVKNACKGPGKIFCIWSGDPSPGKLYNCSTGTCI